jgi:hypothetical protein
MLPSRVIKPTACSQMPVYYRGLYVFSMASNALLHTKTLTEVLTELKCIAIHWRTLAKRIMNVLIKNMAGDC